MTSKQIERRPLPSRAEFYRHYANPNTPVVFTGVMDDWNAAKTWTFDWFKEKHGAVPVFVNTGRYDDGMTRKDMTLGEYIDAIVAGQKIGYLSNINLFKLIPSLAPDVQFPHFQWLDRLTLRNFWMSRAGQFTQLHRDFGHNLVGQMVGRKRFQLYAPEAESGLYPTNEGWAGEFSLVDYEKTEQKIREAGQAVPIDYDVLLQPGELLFLPYGWWHRVMTEDEPAIGINLWWWTPKMLMQRGPMMVRELGGSYIRKRVLKQRKVAGAA